MSDDTAAELEALRRHVTEQDAEIYRQSREIESLRQAVGRLADRLKQLEGRDGGDGAGSPADERPPHY